MPLRWTQTGAPLPSRGWRSGLAFEGVAAPAAATDCPFLGGGEARAKKPGWGGTGAVKPPLPQGGVMGNEGSGKPQRFLFCPIRALRICNKSH